MRSNRTCSTVCIATRARVLVRKEMERNRNSSKSSVHSCLDSICYLNHLTVTYCNYWIYYELLMVTIPACSSCSSCFFFFSQGFGFVKTIAVHRTGLNHSGLGFPIPGLPGPARSTQPWFRGIYSQTRRKSKETFMCFSNKHNQL